MIDITQIPFELGLVEAALTHGQQLYVRTSDEVAHVAVDGIVTVLHTFDAQSPLAFKGLVLVGDDLMTIDRPLGATPILTSVSLQGEVERYPAVPLHHPSGLTVLAGQPVVSDQQPPLTKFLLGTAGARVPVDARNLTHWEVSGDELVYSDAIGLHQGHPTNPRTVMKRTGILTFDLAGHCVIQKLEEGRPVFEVVSAGTSRTVTEVNRPAALHRLSGETFVRFRNQIAPALMPDALETLPKATDLGTVAEVCGGLSYLDDDRQLRWSADGVYWKTFEPAIRASDVVPVNELELVLTGRRASAWVRSAAP